MYQDRISQEELDKVYESGFKAGQIVERRKSINEYIMEGIRCLGIKFLAEDDIIKVKWRHGDKHYIVPFGGLLELWEKYEEQDG